LLIQCLKIATTSVLLVFNITFNNISVIIEQYHTHFRVLVMLIVEDYTATVIKLCSFVSRPSWLWWYGSWIYNYLCNQCLSPL